MKNEKNNEPSRYNLQNKSIFKIQSNLLDTKIGILNVIFI